MNEALREAIKELLRVCVLAVVPVLIAYLEAGKFDWKGLAVLLGVAVLRAVDKFLHENEKAKPVKAQVDAWLKLRGLTGF